MSLHALKAIALTPLLFVQLACNPSATITAVSSDVYQLLQDKTLVESLVHDLKTAYTDNSPVLQQAQAQYADAQAAQAGYLAAVNAAVASPKSVAIDSIAASADQKVAQFIATAAQALAPSLARSVSTARVAVFPASFPKAIGHLPQKYHSIAAKKLAALQWASWEQL